MESPSKKKIFPVDIARERGINTMKTHVNREKERDEKYERNERRAKKAASYLICLIAKLKRANLLRAEAATQS